MDDLAQGYWFVTSSLGSLCTLQSYKDEQLVVEKNEPESFRWYLKAANLGDEKSMCEVAKNYALGKGVEKNLAEADKWFAKINEDNYRRALHELA